MLTEGWLWNTIVLVARGASLLACFRRAVPDLVACFEILQCYVGSHCEQAITEEVYRIIPSVNFSTAVLAPQSDRLLVAPTRQMQWSDWETKERIMQRMASLREAAHTSSVPTNGLGLAVVAS
jgi:hypothetical protein